MLNAKMGGHHFLDTFPVANVNSRVLFSIIEVGEAVPLVKPYHVKYVYEDHYSHVYN
jgi:hypothetical protein